MWKSLRNYIFLFMAVLCLQSCGSTSHLSKDASFKTLITADDAKRFELNYARPERKIDLTQPRNERNPYRDELSERQLLRNVDELIATTRFCRNGYFLLGRHAGETTQKIRGECKDSATEQDKITFPNTIIQW